MSEELNPAATLETPSADPAAEMLGDKPKPLSQSVNIVDVGPCRKHVRVIIDRTDIDERINEQFKKMMPDVVVPGYRPGKAPRKLIEKRFFREVADQIKGELLLQSLEQLAEDHKLNPISQPNINPLAIELPETGPLTYEFEIEVVPEFDLPAYKGLKLKRPTKLISEADLDEAQKRFLRRLGTVLPKDGPAAAEDVLIADVHITLRGEELTEFKNLELRMDPQLAFSDGVAHDFGKQMTGVTVGETRQLDIKLAPTLANADLRGQTVQGAFNVKEIRVIKPAELTEDLFSELGVANIDQLREKLKLSLQRQLEYEQRRAAREQVLAHIGAAATWDLPHDLLHRQASRTLSRRIMEMRSAGFSEEDIRARSALLQQDVLASTAKALKEHFVLQKIAEVEKIEVSDDDVDFEIENMAEQSGESPRKVRARVERENLMETLVTEVLERKALDLVLGSAGSGAVPFVPAPATAGMAAVHAPPPGTGPPAAPAEPKEEE